MNDELLQTLEYLMTFESVAGQPGLQDCADWIADYFADSGLVVKKYVHNGVSSVMVVTHDTKSPEIMMQGHFDVVAGGCTDYQAQKKGDKIYGPGALDMKGSVAVMMVLMKEIAKQDLNMSVGAMFNGDEESGGFNSAEYLVQEEGYTTDLLINFDGGYGEKISHAEKGIIRLELIARENQTTSVHMPWLGGNAIDTLMDAYQKFRELFGSKHMASADDNWHTTYNAWGLGADIEQSRTAHEARLKLSMHYVEDYSVDEYVAKIQAELPMVTVHKILGAERVFVSKDHPVILEWKEIMDRVFEQNTPIIGENGSSDARFLSHLNIPMIITRPAGKDPEGKNEYVSLSSLQKLAQTTREFIQLRTHYHG